MTIQIPRPRLAVPALIIVLGLSACNSGPRIQASGPVTTQRQPISDDPCVLVTKADAEAILGDAVHYTSSESSRDRSFNACAYAAKSQTFTKIVEIFLQPLNLGPGHDPWKADKSVSQENGKTIQPVAELGKDAFLAEGRLHVLTEKWILEVSVDGFTTETQNIDAEKAIAQKALSRLSGPVAPVAIDQQPVDHDPCQSVTKADAETILGDAVHYAKSESSPDLRFNRCAYKAPSDTSTKSVLILTTPLRGHGGDQASDLWHAVKMQWKDGSQPVIGLGNDAFLEPSGKLHVLTENSILEVSVDGFKTDAQNIDAEKAFAQKALSRM
jgi:hypothetical protein